MKAYGDSILLTPPWCHVQLYLPSGGGTLHATVYNAAEAMTHQCVAHPTAIIITSSNPHVWATGGTKISLQWPCEMKSPGTAGFSGTVGDPLRL